MLNIFKYLTNALFGNFHVAPKNSKFKIILHLLCKILVAAEILVNTVITQVSTARLGPNQRDCKPPLHCSSLAKQASIGMVFEILLFVAISLKTTLQSFQL